MGGTVSKLEFSKIRCSDFRYVSWSLAVDVQAAIVILITTLGTVPKSHPCYHRHIESPGKQNYCNLL